MQFILFVSTALAIPASTSLASSGLGSPTDPSTNTNIPSGNEDIVSSQNPGSTVLPSSVVKGTSAFPSSVEKDFGVGQTTDMSASINSGSNTGSQSLGTSSGTKPIIPVSFQGAGPMVGSTLAPPSESSLGTQFTSANPGKTSEVGVPN